MELKGRRRWPGLGVRVSCEYFRREEWVGRTAGTTMVLRSDLVKRKSVLEW